MQYSAMLDEIVSLVGGPENVDGALHCVTRLRFRLKDPKKADLDALGRVKGSLGAVQSGGQTQVIIGTHVGEVYDELMATYHFGAGDDLSDAATMKAQMADQKVENGIIDLISGLFTPVLGMMMATGIIKGILALLQALSLIDIAGGLYTLLSAMGDSFFYFMPIFLGYTAMRRFGGTAALGALMGATLVYPSIVSLAGTDPNYTLFAGTMFEAPVIATLGPIPLVMMSYTSTVIPIICICAVAAPLERWLSRHVPALVKSFVAPSCTLVAALLLGFVVIGPVIKLVSNLLGAFMISVFSVAPVIAGFLYGGLIQVCVIFGVHWGFVAICLNNLATLGYDPVTICGLSCGLSFAGVCLAIVIRTRDERLKGVAIPAFISALVGVTEPAIYGVTLQRKRTFVVACVASAIGGAILGAGGVRQYSFGVNGVFGWIQVINPATGFDSSVMAAIVASVVSFVVAFGTLMALWPKLGIDSKG